MFQFTNSSRTDFQERKVFLIVEDDSAIRDTLVQLFRELTPHYILQATDAIQALGIVKSLIPDLLIVDYWLPNMNGLELYDHVQMREELKGVLVLFISADHSIHELHERHASFLTKPFDLDELLQIVATILGG